MKALLLVDIQNDFVPGGALAVSKGDEIVPIINRLMNKKFFDVIVASKDWHPKDHLSFASQHQGKKVGDMIELNHMPQILWPDHCVQGTKGADFVPTLNKEAIDHVILKGKDRHIDSYSAFFDNGHLVDTGLSDYLRKQGVDEIYIAGLTTDYCVKYTVLDALKLGFKVFVIADACRAVNLKKDDEKQAIEEMKSKGAYIITSKDLLSKKEFL